MACKGIIGLLESAVPLTFAMIGGQRSTDGSNSPRQPLVALARVLMIPQCIYYQQQFLFRSLARRSKDQLRSRVSAAATEGRVPVVKRFKLVFSYSTGFVGTEVEAQRIDITERYAMPPVLPSFTSSAQAVCREFWITTGIFSLVYPAPGTYLLHTSIGKSAC